MGRNDGADFRGFRQLGDLAVGMVGRDNVVPHLPAGYYLDHFAQVIAGVRARCGFLLTAAEREYLAQLDALSEPARMLYARLVNRRGPFFRVERLKYPEIGPLNAALSDLLAAGLLLPCEGVSAAPVLCERFWACFTHAELRAALRNRAFPKTAGKDALVAWIAGSDDYASWLASFLAAHPAVQLPGTAPWPFLRFLFFGELRDNLADFVTRALGHVVTESIDAGHLAPHFATRQQAEDAYRMALLYVDFRHIRACNTGLAALDWWRRQAVDRTTLHAGLTWFDRLVDRLGRMLEREGQLAAALELYGGCPVAPARERRARLLLKCGNLAGAFELLHAIQDAPCHFEEAYAARQLLARLERRSRRSEARGVELASASIVLDYEDGGVEAAVLAHYRAEGWQGIHSENWLWNAAFGLLFWDIIYDAEIGGFHSPLQLAPSDLYDRAFYVRRQLPIESRLTLLAEPAAAADLVRRHFAAKQGVANPFVAWNADLPDLIGIMLDRLPAAGLAAAFRHLAQDFGRHSRGFPDLFLWCADNYRFVEIKTENDHLAPHQYEWLRVLQGTGLHASLERVRRPRAAGTGYR